AETLEKLLREVSEANDDVPGHLSRELMGQRHDGGVFPIDVVINTVVIQSQVTAIIRDTSERKALQKEVLEIAAEEQRRIGQDLHDGIQQELIGLSMIAQGMIETLDARQAPEATTGARLLGGFDKALANVRRLS